MKKKVKLFDAGTTPTGPHTMPAPNKIISPLRPITEGVEKKGGRENDGMHLM